MPLSQHQSWHWRGDVRSRIDALADSHYAAGERAGSDSDGYVRTTVYLATVLFLVGISGHFRVRPARLGLIGVTWTTPIHSVERHVH
jgi:hypothetical protein